MELFEHVCRYLFRDEDGNHLFKSQSYLVAYPVSYQECQLGEELLCRIGCGYYYTGLGFNIQDAGVGVESSKLANMAVGEAEAVWSTIQEARYENSIWGDQLCSDFEQFNAKYIARCEEMGGPASLELQQLEEENLRLCAERERLLQDQIPLSETDDMVNSLRAQLVEMENDAASEDEGKDVFRRLQTRIVEDAREAATESRHTELDI